MGDGRMTRETGVGFFCKENPKPRGVIFLQRSGWGVGNEGCGDSLKETKSRGVIPLLLFVLVRVGNDKETAVLGMKGLGGFP